MREAAALQSEPLGPVHLSMWFMIKTYWTPHWFLCFLSLSLPHPLWPTSADSQHRAALQVSLTTAQHNSENVHTHTHGVQIMDVTFCTSWDSRIGLNHLGEKKSNFLICGIVQAANLPMRFPICSAKWFGLFAPLKRRVQGNGDTLPL